MDSAKRPQELVYLYQYWDEETGAQKVSTIYATMVAIHCGLGVALHGTGQLVNVSEIHGGVFHPPA